MHLEAMNFDGTVLTIEYILLFISICEMYLG